ncbi:MAG: hemerythrin domain-containing protein [Candidatus Hydrothermarchaeota archaeon]
MSALDAISKDHRMIAKRIQLLEEASLSILRKRISGGEDSNPVEEFLKFFRIGVMQHFKIEETALFPVLQDVFKDKEPQILELLSEHKRIMDKYLSLHNAESSKEARTERLINLLNDLSAHARKEESLLPPLVKMLNEKQLKRIDEAARKLRYPV